MIAESAAWSECVKNDRAGKRGDDEFQQGNFDHKLRGFYFDDVLRSPAFLADVFFFMNFHPRGKNGRPAQDNQRLFVRLFRSTTGNRPTS